MKYVNANDILPEALIAEIQKYAQGTLLYIPNQRGVRKKWGEKSGYRSYLARRNEAMKKHFSEGATIEELSTYYSLSCESIKKIVYSKKSP
ncbi:CD3324 family protein [Paenibacillus thiaminolyticus]|uniref:CD3324 family protein n=1 Tax=Paenibacillus thiaminolyticus TaxID=49283 RepID=A0AAP9DRM2_PANTH|nr:CD3324 family protein [Paenibacillus thiaminolyticus]MCY9537825.1 CD3324 family protein [Paenibacillus thiaminolyticus]MCY9605117.1 CD3324 family protein [Paenibacillus thiaminolyticus]MCY9607196.1 CD3324 family protein [Paenibacillus thiaminolyticus]MCY9616321.1 CD3324 family protein [Paenibacillus thiaminolyticus]MCY9620026.1 CD3324 family protein [Paenibacillus thiaminolyticus]